MKRKGPTGSSGRAWALALAGALTVATTWAGVEWQQACGREAQVRDASDDVLRARLAKCARRVRAIEIERDLRVLLSERPLAAATTDPVAVERRRRLAELDRELADVEARIADLKGRMVRLPLSSIQAIPEGPQIAGARQAVQAVSTEVLILDARSEREDPLLERKKREKDRLESDLAAATADDLVRRKNQAYVALEDALTEQVHARKVRIEERDRLAAGLAGGALAAPPPDGGTDRSTAISSLARQLAADPLETLDGAEGEEGPPSRRGRDASSPDVAWPFPFLLGCLAGVVSLLLLGGGGRGSEEEACSDAEASHREWRAWTP